MASGCNHLSKVLLCNRLYYLLELASWVITTRLNMHMGVSNQWNGISTGL